MIKEKAEISWQDKYVEILEDEYTDHFGHNIDFDFFPCFSKIEKLGGEITILDSFTIKAHLPKKSEEVLLYILHKLPGASSAKFNKKKQELTLEWHF